MVGQRFNCFAYFALAFGLALSIPLVAEHAQGQSAPSASDGSVGDLPRPGEPPPDLGPARDRIQQLRNPQIVLERQAQIAELNQDLHDLNRVNNLLGSFLSRHTDLVVRFSDYNDLITRIQEDCRMMDENAIVHSGNPFMRGLQEQADNCRENLSISVFVYEYIDEYLYEVAYHVELARITMGEYGVRSDRFLRQLRALADSSELLQNQEGVDEILDNAMNNASRPLLN